jgi:aspartokinase-like uncharacterized kinase
VVVKLGGSLLMWKALPLRLARFLEWCREEGAMVILVTGGGAPANFVRDLDIAHKIDDTISHVLAIRSMDLTCHCLASLLPTELTAVDDFADFVQIWTAGKTPVLAPHRFVTEVDARLPNSLPASWRVTSDSIAARLAETVRAHDLVLLKSRDVPPGTSIRQAVKYGLVDPMLPEVAAGVPRVLSLNFRDPTAIARELIKG